MLRGSDSLGESAQITAQRGDRVTRDLLLLEVLVVGLKQLCVLVLDLLRSSIRRTEEQWLEVVVHVLAGGLGHLPVNDACIQVADEGASRRGNCWQGLGGARR